MIPIAALGAGPLARAARAGTARRGGGRVDRCRRAGWRRSRCCPAPTPRWTLAPQALIGLGLGLTVDSLTAVALRDRLPRALHGGWTIAARHGGIVAGLLILTPVFTADLATPAQPAQEAIAALVLDSPLPASTKLALAEGLGEQLDAEGGRVPDLAPAFERADLPAGRAVARGRAGARRSTTSSSAPRPARSATPSSWPGCWPCWRWCRRCSCAGG